MRGILVQSLASRGVPFDVALKIANDVRQQIAGQGTGEVEVEALRTLVEELLPEGFDIDAHELRRLAPTPPRVISSSGSSTPFSKGILSISLQGAGLDTSDAYEVCQDVEGQLLRSRASEIDRSDLRALVGDTIERAHGSRAARRYQTWRAAVQDAKPIFLLLGGSTGAGKTSIAVEVARRLEISRVIGTDSIRQIMRLMFSEDLMPEIHSSTYEVHHVLESGRPRPGDEVGSQVISGYREQAQKIAVGVQALLDRALEENTSVLIEGVNLIPGMIDLERYRDRAHVISLVVSTLDRDQYQDRFARREERALARAQERYLPHFGAILEIQDYILAQAEQFGLPIIDNVQFDDAILSVIRSVIGTLEKSGRSEA
jgi:2-phosphoglycerate kinase